jgi:hypothetical protein
LHTRNPNSISISILDFSRNDSNRPTAKQTANHRISVCWNRKTPMTIMRLAGLYLVERYNVALEILWVWQISAGSINEHRCFRRLPVVQIASAPAACSAAPELLCTSPGIKETPALSLPFSAPGLIRHARQRQFWLSGVFSSVLEWAYFHCIKTHCSCQVLIL